MTPTLSPDAAPGPVPPANQPGHHPDQEQDKPTGPFPSAVLGRFEFEFEPAFRLAALPFGVRPDRAGVEVRRDELDIHFGPWHVQIPRDDIVSVEVTGPYSPIKVIGPPHLSLRDRGLTLGTNHRRGVCIRLRRPIRGIDPLGLIRHPGVTVTVADPDRLVALLEGGA
jgi:hypothetical protein